MSEAPTRQSVLDPNATGLVQLSELRMMPYRDRVKHASAEQFDSHPELFKKPKIYIASKAHHRPRWRAVRDNGYEIVSQWIDTEDKFTLDPTDLDFVKLWEMCLADIKSCDVLVLYVEDGERLKGALVELGAAIALNKEIIVTGRIGDNGSWHNHPKIEVSGKTLEEVLTYIYHG